MMRRHKPSDAVVYPYGFLDAEACILDKSTAFLLSGSFSRSCRLDISTRQVAEQFGIHRSTLYRHLNARQKRSA